MCLPPNRFNRQIAARLDRPSAGGETRRGGREGAA